MGLTRHSTRDLDGMLARTEQGYVFSVVLLWRVKANCYHGRCRVLKVLLCHSREAYYGRQE